MKDKNEKLNEAFANIDAAFIEKAATPPKRKRATLISMVLIAAVMISVVAIPFFTSDKSDFNPPSATPPNTTPSTPTTPHVPIDGEPNYIYTVDSSLIDNEKLPENKHTADEIGKAYKAPETYGPTKAYTTLQVPSAAYLNLAQLPSGEWITVFKEKAENTTPSKQAYADFLNGILPNLFSAISVPYSETITEGMIESSQTTTPHYHYNQEPYQMRSYCAQTKTEITLTATDPYHETKLDGMTVSIDQTKRDVEIIKDLESIRIKLCEIFGVELADTMIIRTYDAYSKNGAEFFDVYFYNKSDHPANELIDANPYLGTSSLNAPFSDYINLHFDNVKNYPDDYASSTVVTNVDIAYIKFHAPAKERWERAKVKMISLSQAEELLKKGYVFGFHMCERCMENQTAVDFSDYNYVGFVYKESNDHQLMPFYAFYKYLGKTPNSNSEYALTYVPAFEISGLEEYFKEQTANHKDSPFG